MAISKVEQRKNAKKFAEYWKGKGYEKGDSQPFWLSLLRDVLGVESPEKVISFEEQVKLEKTSFIDGFIESTHTLIEQKSLDKSLDKPIKQSDGTMLTPLQQVKRYGAELEYSNRPRWIVTCNFEKFYIYDMEKPHAPPEIVWLKDLEKEYYRLSFLADSTSETITKEEEISVKAGEIVGKLYNALYKQYNNINEQSLKSLNVLCVRLVFCFYAEDADIFGEHAKFYNYIKNYNAKTMRNALIELFKVLDTKSENRDPYLEEELATFPYVNGGLFSDENIEIPRFTDEIVNIILHEASEKFDWSQISPTIFGAVFESTLNPDTRRSGGMHYTSIKNIHKVIDPLFLDNLFDEFDEIKGVQVETVRNKKLKQFQEKLATLTFFDPACGSGNFLTESYLSLRRLENEVIALQKYNQISFGDTFNPIKVSITQFYGIEINDFAVTVATTALWIAESQMLKKTEEIVNMELDFLPLKSYTNITEGNALRVEWEEVVPKDKLNYIMGNPPFVGARLMLPEQKKDMNNTFKGWKNIGNLDYVSCWYKKCSELMKGTKIKSALVSTNSISQGEQVAILWKPLYEFGIKIDFAHQTFRWDSEATEKAHVHCVIIGFSTVENKDKKSLYNADKLQLVENINPYLIDAPTVFIESRKTPISAVPNMVFGNMPNDSGYLSNYSTEDKNVIVKQYPKSEKLFKKIVGSAEFINKRERWCLWLKDVAPNEYNKIPPIIDAVKNVKEMRDNSSRLATQKLALTPYLFGEIRQPNSDYLLIPSTSSENRRYVPIGFMDKEVISSNANLIIPNATLYEFGVLTSNVHMSWMRAVCGRLKSDYRYSANIVYNNFPWCNPTTGQKAKIEQTAQDILDARSKYPECSLADLYDEVAMPKELRKAHQDNDRAVMNAYGFEPKNTNETTCVAKLMTLYQELTK